MARKLRAAEFRPKTKRTHEMNTLYDLPGAVLRKRNELLRIRKYGREWTLTFKRGTKRARHSSREEIETKVADGKTMDTILKSLGFRPTFRYEKFRAEWADRKQQGHVVVDETPIGNFCEIEGPPRWIDAMAKSLGVSREQYITKNYATLFQEWKHLTGKTAKEMTFASLGQQLGPIQ